MIPFSLIPEKVLYDFSKHFLVVGNFLSSFFPLLGDWVKQAEYKYGAREFASMAFVASMFNAIFLIVFLSLISFGIKKDLLTLTIALALLLVIISFLSIIFYPSVVSIRRARGIDYSLIHAVRQIVIELRSGVTLFVAINSVTVDYGETSKEFKKIVNSIEGGSPELDVLAEVSSTTPSMGLRKILWQISNALKVGSDVSVALEAQLQDLTKERIEHIKRYGQELSPWTMMYMMGAVIFPSLGVTVLIVLSTFLNATLPPVIFPVILVLLLGFQLFFMNLVSSRRPLI